MDGNRFDALTRGIASTSRRSLVKGAFGAVAAGLLTTVGLREADAAKKPRQTGETCRVASECASGVCEIARDGRRRCVGCVNNNCDQCVQVEACFAGLAVSCGAESHCAVVQTVECGTTCTERNCDAIECATSADCPQDSYCIKAPGCCSGDLELSFCSTPCQDIIPTGVNKAATKGWH